MNQTKEVENNQNFYDYKKQIENELKKRMENEWKAAFFILGVLFGCILFLKFEYNIEYLTNANYHQYKLCLYLFIITIGYIFVKIFSKVFISSPFFKKQLNQEILYETGEERKPLIINIINLICYILLIAPIIIKIVLNYYDFFNNYNFLIPLLYF